MLIDQTMKALGYRWWTVFAWIDSHDAGVKLGPLTVWRMRGKYSRYWGVSVLGNSWYDGWILAQMQLRKERDEKAEA